MRILVAALGIFSLLCGRQDFSCGMQTLNCSMWDSSWNKVKSLSCGRLFSAPWTVACQAPPFMGFSRQEYQSGLPFPSPGDLPNPGIKPRSPAPQADSLPSEPPGKPPDQGANPRPPAWGVWSLSHRSTEKSLLCYFLIYHFLFSSFVPVDQVTIKLPCSYSVKLCSLTYPLCYPYQIYYYVLYMCVCVCVCVCVYKMYTI